MHLFLLQYSGEFHTLKSRGCGLFIVRASGAREPFLFHALFPVIIFWFLFLNISVTDLTFTSLLVYFSMVAYLCWQFPVNSHSTSVEGGINPKLLIVVGYLYEHAFTFSLVVALNFWITVRLIVLFSCWFSFSCC